MKRFEMCPRHQKKSYPTRTAAIRAALRYSKARGTALRVYVDPACGRIHLTSKVKRGWTDGAA